MRRGRVIGLALVGAVFASAVAPASADVPPLGSSYSGRTSQRHSISLNVDVGRRVAWSFRHRARCRKKLTTEYGQIRRGVYGDLASYFDTAPRARRRAFSDRERWTQGINGGRELHNRLSIRGKWSSRQRASGTARIRAALWDFTQERVVTHCGTGLIRWRVSGRHP